MLQQMKRAPEEGLLNSTAGEGEATVTRIYIFLQEPVLLCWSLQHFGVQHLVCKHKPTSRESEWKKTTAFESQGGCPHAKSTQSVLKFPSVSLRGSLTQHCDLVDGAETAFLIANYLKTPCSVFPPFVYQNEILCILISCQISLPNV